MLRYICLSTLRFTKWTNQREKIDRYLFCETKALRRVIRSTMIISSTAAVNQKFNEKPALCMTTILSVRAAAIEGVKYTNSLKEKGYKSYFCLYSNKWTELIAKPLFLEIRKTLWLSSSQLYRTKRRAFQGGNVYCHGGSHWSMLIAVTEKKPRVGSREIFVVRPLRIHKSEDIEKYINLGYKRSEFCHSCHFCINAHVICAVESNKYTSRCLNVWSCDRKINVTVKSEKKN